MKRFGWLILLVSLGLNLGLGWRLMNQLGSQPAEWCGPWDQGSEGRSWRRGRADGEGGSGRSFSGQRRGDFFRPAPGDSGAWREIMERRLERITRRLDLDPSQVKSFRVTHGEAAARFREQRQLVEEAESYMFGLASRSPVEPDSIRVAVRNLGRRRALLDSLVTEAMLRELDSLNPDQRELYLRILPWSRSGSPEAGLSGRRQYPKSGHPPSGRGE
ncbi:MAG: periplasmic heavy metal sensor [Gemmatimonadales bacterium]|nr:periplasmic heavy metal sensor [Gemmatimonadales bacterium]